MRKKLTMQPIGLTIDEGIEQWITYCHRRGLTEKTIQYYKDITSIFVSNIECSNELSVITEKVIDSFILKLQGNGVKTTTINSYLNGIRSICNWWAKQEYIKPFKIQKIKCDEVIKDTFNEYEVKAILKKPNLKKCSFLEYESWVLCNIFYGLGARASTITSLTISDLDFENGYIIYRKVKDRRQTIIPMPNSLKAILQEFLMYRKGQDTDYLFVNAFGNKLTVDTLNHILNNYYKSRNVMKTGIHIWRRTFAKDYIVNGGSALKLQAQLCHKTLDMTKKYVSLYGKDIRDDEHNPLEMLNRNTFMTMKKGGKK